MCLRFVAYSSTVAILGSKQHVGRTQTIRTPLARCGPTFRKIASSNFMKKIDLPYYSPIVLYCL